MAADPIELLTASDAADVLNVSVWTVYRRVEANRLRVHARTRSGISLFHPNDVYALQRVTSPSLDGTPVDTEEDAA